VVILMALNGVGATNSQIGSALGAVTGSSSSQLVSEQAFLQLLITQLQNQDPLSPADPTQFVSQLASFSSLEQMTQLNANVTQQLDNSVTGLIGQTVTVTDPASQSGLLTGTVTGIVYYSNGPAIQINGNNYALSDIQNVGNITTTGS
jgi:flagellar basal-body rod modification protein FlgD